MTPVVVDASVALCWLLVETESETAFDLLENRILHAPDFLNIEVANVLWTKTRSGKLTRESADELFLRFSELPIAMTPAGELLTRARSIAWGFNLTLYDSLYVALAERLSHPLATMDQGISKALTVAGRTDLLLELG